jgi:hypothetical protein
MRVTTGLYFLLKGGENFGKRETTGLSNKDAYYSNI